MLTDYHVHLRPDRSGTTAELFFTPENAERYRQAASGQGITELGVSEHIYRFTEALEIWEHELWRENAVDDMAAYVDFLASEGLRKGIEADFVPGREDRIANLLDRYPYDYVVGSVHFLGDLAVDHRGYDIWDGNRSADSIWQEYFDTLAELVRSDLFDILAHPDLVKVWGSEIPAPERDPRFYYEPVVEAIAEHDIAVEISTAGIRKPVGELYPDDAFAQMCVEAGAVFALSSDAHEPEHIGYAYDEALAAIERWGITELAVFENRQRRTETVG